MYLNSKEILAMSSKRFIVSLYVVIILLTQEQHVNKDQETMKNTTNTKFKTLRQLSFGHDARNVTKFANGKCSSIRDELLTGRIIPENMKKLHFPLFKTINVQRSWIHEQIPWKNIIIIIFIFAFFERLSIFRKCTEGDVKRSEKENLFQLTHFTGINHYTVWPSLNQYFNDAVTGTKESLMNYEWIRYETFKLFPDTSVVTPMRLAQAGFYYTGEGEETICFSCGLKNKQWKEHEAVIDTHKRLSPDCLFVNGTDKTNVPIHATKPVTNTATSSQSQGACGGPDDDDDDVNATDESQRPCFHKEQVTNDYDLDNTTTSKQPPLAPNVDTKPCQNIDRFPGIFRETPKYPDYAIKSKRQASFEGQTNHFPISTIDLAEAGFFRAGPNDEVRCFFCGGGMRSWQQGDDPWIEHARWFPHCAYVRQFRGDNFVNLCRASNVNTDVYDVVAQSGNQTRDVTDRLVEDLNSAAARTVLDMGYSQEQVEEAIKHYHHGHDSTEIRAQHLLEYLIDNTYVPSQLTDTVGKKANTNTQTQQNSAVPMTCNTLITGDKNKNKLEEENEKLKEKMLCKICFDKDASIVFLPCGHMVSCVECSQALRKCAVCRKLIEGRIKTYLS